MKWIDTNLERVRAGAPIPLPLAALLTAATPLVRLGMWRRRRLPRVRVSAQVISFGNITAGGTGKTPAVIEYARRCVDAGRRVAVVTRGYGSRRITEPALLEPGQPLPCLARDFGDEAALIAHCVPGIHVVKSADRVAGARFAIERLGCDVIILDDGYQYLPLERDENILLIDATNPFGNGRLVPRGILREPLAAMARATSIVLTRCDQTADPGATVARIRALCPGIPIRLTRHAPARLWRVADGEPQPVEALQGREIEARCAIGNPAAFFQTLEGLGAKTVSRTAHRDHARMTALPDTEACWVVVTEKDAVRLENPPPNVYALGVDLADFTE